MSTFFLLDDTVDRGVSLSALSLSLLPGLCLVCEEEEDSLVVELDLCALPRCLSLSLELVVESRSRSLSLSLSS